MLNRGGNLPLKTDRLYGNRRLEINEMKPNLKRIPTAYVIPEYQNEMGAGYDESSIVVRPIIPSVQNSNPGKPNFESNLIMNRNEIQGHQASHGGVFEIKSPRNFDS